MLLLTASVAALGLGPLIERAVRRHRRLTSSLDAFIVVAITGLVLFHVLPDAWRVAGAWALLAGLIGLFLPRVLESGMQGLARTAHGAALAIGIAGLVVHAAVDGMALADIGGEPARLELGLAVILHRLPVGLTIWILVKKHRGRAFAVAILGAMGLSTVIGCLAADQLAGGIDHQATGIFTGLVAGSLLHVILHPLHHTEEAGEAPLRVPAAIGALLAVLLLWIFFDIESHGHGHAHDHAGHAHHHGHHHGPVFGGWSEAFLELALLSAPALVLAFLAAGLMHLFVPRASVRWLGRGGAVSRSLRGMAFGLPLPLCSCGVVPVFRGLAAQGAPPAAALAFLVATPELGLDAVLISLPLLGGELTLVRVAAAALLAVTVGVAVSAFVRRAPDAPGRRIGADEAAGERFGRRLRAALREGVVDVFDATIPWIVVGLAVAAVFGDALRESAFAAWPPALQIPLLALVGIPVYVCASAATPLVAVLIAGGVSPGAGLAFLLTGPATNVTTWGVLKQAYGGRAATVFVAVIIATAIGLGFATDLVVDAPLATGVEDLHDHDEGGAWRVVEIVSLGLLTALLLTSLVRLGPRGLLVQVLPWAGEDADHDHDHDHDGEAAGGDGNASGPCCGGGRA